MPLAMDRGSSQLGLSTDFIFHLFLNSSFFQNTQRSHFTNTINPSMAWLGCTGRTVEKWVEGENE